MDKLKEYENAMIQWRELMKDEAKNALQLNSLGEDIAALRKELIEDGLIEPQVPTDQTQEAIAVNV